MAGRRRAWPPYAFGIVFGVLVALFVLQTDPGSAPEDAVRASVQRYQVTTDRLVDADVTVSRDDPTRAALCELTAQDAQGREVGRREVRAPAQPTGQEITELTVSLPTTARAQSVAIGRCAQLAPAPTAAP